MVTIIAYLLFSVASIVWLVKFFLDPEKHMDPERIIKGSIPILITAAIFGSRWIVKSTLDEGPQDELANYIESLVWISVSYFTGKILDDSGVLKDKSDMYKNLFFIESFIVGACSLKLSGKEADLKFWALVALPKMLDITYSVVKQAVLKIRKKECKALLTKDERQTLLLFAAILSAIIYAGFTKTYILLVLTFVPVVLIGVLCATWIVKLEKNICNPASRK